MQLVVTPHGRLIVEAMAAGDEAASAMSSSAAGSLSEAAAKLLSKSFASSSADGLLLLAKPVLKDELPPPFVFWREWSRRFFQSLCQWDEDALTTFAKDKSDSIPVPPDELELAVIVADAPPMRGLEYLTPAVLKALWGELAELMKRLARETDGGVVALLREVAPQRHLLGRVTFHLAENKRDPDRPFAFLATYTHRLSAKGQVQHLPLAQALKQYAGEQDRTKLAELLAPVRAAGDVSPLVKELLASRDLFQPQAWTIQHAYRFLRDVPLFEQSGLVARVPNWWRPRQPPRAKVEVRVGDSKKSSFGADQLLEFSVGLSLDGEPLSVVERRKLLAATEGLMLLRGKWIEVDQEQLQSALQQWEQLEDSYSNGIDFLQGMRLLAGATLEAEDDDVGAAANWSSVVAGDWLGETLKQLRDPSGVVGCEPGEGLNATLRPYQADGVRWLWFLTRLGFGACLADDMGLGKTIQVIDLLLRLKGADVGDGHLSKRPPTGLLPVDSGLCTTQLTLESEVVQRPASHREKPGGVSQKVGSHVAPPTGCASKGLVSNPSLLVVPASLVGNWKQELAKFAPQLKAFYAHRSECDEETLTKVAKDPQGELAEFDIVVTTYTLVRRAEWLSKRAWRVVVLDEAQAIKNATSAQTKAVKKLDSAARIALTGTPVENQLGDLWSLFDFCCPGLLGTAKQFKSFVKRLGQQQDAAAYGSLRRLVQPYILRRMKTDPNIVPDLPDKTEMKVTCGLSKKQAVLYEKVVADLEEQLEDVDGMQRRGVVLGSLMRLKQICNHPSQFLDQPEYLPTDSAKFTRLADICGEIIERQEKVLVFTQFQSLCEPLSRFLEQVFQRPGLVLHGGVPVAKRKQLVQRFQEEDSLPFFVISVKAGGTGLNLTAASHVVHFDRWWNPAVENQATDRAFRIGQKRNVLVHKFVCRGTLEERIDSMLQDKQKLAEDILGQSHEGEVLLTEMSDKELLKFVSLDITRAAEEG